jgi:hypothetical protein
MNSVEDFMLDYHDEQVKELMLMTHQLLLDSIPQIQCDIKWKIPFYSYKKSFCFLNPKTKLLILGLMDGHLLSDPHKLLVGEQKLLRHYIIRNADDIFKKEWQELLMELVILYEKT